MKKVCESTDFYLVNLMKVIWQPRISSPSGEDNTDSEDPRVKLQTNSEGDQYLDLGKKKRVTVRSFKGKLALVQTC